MQLLSGNEAIAQGAWEAGAHIGVGYPGTPSTETMERFARLDGVYAEWCPNEKVALEVAVGASAGGARVLATMKHVGVNVAADPLFTAAYTGVGGGILLLAADDPGMHSSQNEQDSRFYALSAHVPIVEPSDSAEAYAFAREAFDLSERFDTPFMIRSTVRISHAKAPVEVGERITRELVAYEKNPAKWVMMPAYARLRRVALDERIEQLRAWSDETPLNRIEMRDSSIGVICSGACYQHVREALPEASILKLGVTWPLPAAKLAEFAHSVDELYCIDEASDYLSTQVAALGIDCRKPPAGLPLDGELSARIIKQGFGVEVPPIESTDANDIPGRPPALCAGCPHRLVFRELARAKCTVCGDIGCYTLGALPPLAAMDTCVCMGASISMAHGFELACNGRFAQEGSERRRVAAVIGDSTFAHSGITSLLNTVYNQGSGLVCILDNRTTGMTGHQGNPINGITLQNRTSRELDLEGLVASLGVEDVKVVDPNDMMAVRSAIKDGLANEDALSVIVFKAPCVLLRDSFVRKDPYFVNGSCTACGLCISLGCPAISKQDDGRASIEQAACVGCGQCAQYCHANAIEQLSTTAKGSR